MLTRTLTIFVILLLFVSSAAFAQQATGFPPFGSISGGSGESIDNANLNVHLAIPIISKPGRGIPFNFELNFDGSVWGPVPSGSSKVWVPVSNWGWTGVTVAQTGYVTYSTTQSGCSYGTGAPPPMYYWNSYHGFVFHDPSGGQHAIPISTSNWQPGAPCGQGTSYGNATGDASDGSGSTMTVYVTSAVNSAAVVSLGGTIAYPDIGGSGWGKVQDSNGNYVSASYDSGTGTWTFTDTLNKAALTISGAGNPVFPTDLRFTGWNGGLPGYEMRYSTVSVRATPPLTAAVARLTAARPPTPPA